ncbi:MAG: hypothetical protein A3B07_01560 [Candidatus Yonathbacteria bacterium RIFCSPLOWO2_01_FULL_43_27]|uniref:Uncharacterized protein n=1 Tax=Candidatus Yonathbacteria bacterium RIFCSPLOWO2_01_FULL_43_27 TaxID=1802726 RepID=A0A1G2SDS7_9BACT|nr:MAG: hypothetical protein A2658_01355 [Candidatus Yonathbacteria bacterium RIFCSPHIGHO2_01_FULL_44_19]OHA82601.1 MAG: hypothetical protein A3B07_01560 [Candidatus Yonathbacteria bacterium RIFCSPLOWO2_01_FULL_43_27]
MEFVRIEKLDPHKLYKVCQITIDGKPLIYFVEDSRGCYHKNILNEVLTLNALPHTVIRKLGDEGYTFHGEGFVIEGMGGAKLLSEKNILLFGNSANYNMSISKTHVEKYMRSNPEWEFKIPSNPRKSLAS